MNILWFFIGLFAGLIASYVYLSYKRKKILDIIDDVQSDHKERYNAITKQLDDVLSKVGKKGGDSAKTTREFIKKESERAECVGIMKSMDMIKNVL